MNSPHLKNSKKLQHRQQLNIILLKLQNTKERYKEHIFAKIGMVIDKRVCLTVDPCVFFIPHIYFKNSSCLP